MKYIKIVWSLGRTMKVWYKFTTFEVERPNKEENLGKLGRMLWIRTCYTWN